MWVSAPIVALEEVEVDGERDGTDGGAVADLEGDVAGRDSSNDIAGRREWGAELSECPVSPAQSMT